MQTPLIVDLDGTLLRSDMLLESFFALVAEHPLRALGAIPALFRGIAVFKRRIAGQVEFDPAGLPYSEPVLAEIAEARAGGRSVWLVSAADEILVRAIAAHLGLFDGVIGSDGATNLRGKAKAEALVAKFGKRGFDYVGNDQSDVPVWAEARGVLVAHPVAKFLRQVQGRFPGARAVGAPARPQDRLAALRPHQWLKNLLVFVPLLAAHRLQYAPLLAGILGFVAISLTASALYLVNDLVDLARDRMHHTKRHRPLASGKVPLAEALMMVPMLLVAAILISAALPRICLPLLVAYGAGSLIYSLWLKRMMMIDVVALACLYGARLVLGAFAADVKLTAWLAAFSLFLFFALALVKRVGELAQQREPGVISGRAYQSGDEPMLVALAAAAGMVSVLVFALYIDSPAVRILYRAPGHLWFVCVVLLYWIGRIQLLAHRGKIHADPLIFAATDGISLISIAVGGLIVVSAI